jgi:hypothetical protein
VDSVFNTNENAECLPGVVVTPDTTGGKVTLTNMQIDRIEPPSYFKVHLRRNLRLYKAARWLYRVLAPFSFPNPLTVIREYYAFFKDLRSYRRLASAESINWTDLYPYVSDKTAGTPINLSYFYQDTWAAGKIFAAHPKLHVDIGSTALLVGILARFTRVCSFDIRPLMVKLDGLEPCSGSILALPFKDHSIESLSSLCVLEHIGLGRYGDPLEPHGTDLAAAEMQRVLRTNGNLYVSVPIDLSSKVYFNAHRAFTLDGFLKKFPELTLIEGRLIQNGKEYSLEAMKDIDFSRYEVVALLHLRRLAI